MKIQTYAEIKNIKKHSFEDRIWIDHAEKPVNLEFEKTILEENIKIGDKLKITIEKK